MLNFMTWSVLDFKLSYRCLRRFLSLLVRLHKRILMQSSVVLSL